MDHSHNADEIDDAIIQMKKYWQNPKKYEFSSAITEVNGDLLRLEENYFYPEGGGQPSDQGVILSNNQSFSVTDVQESDEVVWLDVPEHNLEEGQPIDARINESRRQTLSRNHSGQHLLSAVFWEEFDLDTTRALIDITDTEIEFDRTPDWSEIEKGLNLANQFIHEEHPILSKFYTEENLEKISLRGGVDGSHKVYRIVEIEQVDLNPCGGTHVENTGEIQTMAITKLDGKRLKFISGRSAAKQLVREELLLHQISRNLHTSVSEISDETTRLYNQNKDLQKSVMDLENRILELELSRSEKKIVSNYEFSKIIVSKLNRGLILEEIGDLDEHELCLVVTVDGGFILSTGSEKISTDLMNELRSHGIRGGGRGTTTMGTIPDEINIDELVQNFLQSKS